MIKPYYDDEAYNLIAVRRDGYAVKIGVSTGSELSGFYVGDGHTFPDPKYL